MNIVDIWIQNDWVVRILLISLAVVFIAVFEKTYQYYKSYKALKQLESITSMDEIDKLDDGFLKQTLVDIKDFSDESQSLFNAYIGVKLDMYEQYMMKYVTLIGIIAVLAPMLGLIGTFIGVWHVFEAVGDISMSDPSMIAKGIKEVIIDTMSGLVVAVIAMIFYKGFESISSKNVSSFEEKVYKLIREK